MRESRRRVKWGFGVGAASIVAVAAVAAPASATVMAALGMNELVAQADEVFVGSVVSQRARWDDRGRIVTDVMFAVEQTAKGAARVGATITIVRFGGAIGDVGMRIEGEPMFDDGERALVFARRVGGPRGMLRPVGMSQGVMPVRDGAWGVMVHPGGAGLALTQRLAGGALAPAPAALVSPRRLDAVLAEIHAIAGGARAP